MIAGIKAKQIFQAVYALAVIGSLSLTIMGNNIGDKIFLWAVVIYLVVSTMFFKNTAEPKPSKKQMIFSRCYKALQGAAFVLFAIYFYRLYF